jgi:hypothetical protein
MTEDWEIGSPRRNGELRDAIAQRTATVVESNGRVTGYATIIGFFGHAVGEGNDDLQAPFGAATPDCRRLRQRQGGGLTGDDDLGGRETYAKGAAQARRDGARVLRFTQN